MNRSLLLADAGGTHVRLRLIGPDGAVLNELKGLGRGEPSFENLMQELGDLCEQHGLGTPGPPRADLVITCRAALPDHPERGALRRLVVLMGARAVTVVPDGVAAYVGCLGSAPGVVVTVGTGTIAVVVDRSGRARRLDGWGPQLGDVGSGYRVGLDGLMNACHWADGRPRGSAVLAAAAENAFGNLRDLPRTVLPADQLRPVARFAEAVVGAARDGDPAARRILDRAARQLGELAVDAAALVGDDPALPVVIGGGFVAAVPELASRVTAWFQQNSVLSPSFAAASAALDGCQRIGSDGIPVPFAGWARQIEELD